MKLKLPQEKEQKQSNIILEMNANIKEILSEISKTQSDTINARNEKEVKELLGKADLIITECHTTKTFDTGKNSKFNRLVYEYQRLNLRYEAYKINEQINSVNEEYTEIKNTQEDIKSQTNNIVYNILGFIVSFSIISSAVAAITNIKSIPDILLFMTFSTFLLLTTLIGLHNFYKNTNKTQSKLQNNYFLWKMMIIIILLLVVYKGVIYVKSNEQEIFESIGRGIGQVIKRQENANNNEN